jgi:hypothetical protein
LSDTAAPHDWPQTQYPSPARIGVHLKAACEVQAVQRLLVGPSGQSLQVGILNKVQSPQARHMRHTGRQPPEGHVPKTQMPQLQVGRQAAASK